MFKKIEHIEIVRSSVKGLSSLSLESSDAIVGVLSKSYANVGVNTVNNLADLQTLVGKNPDLVFLGMEFLPLNLDVSLNDSERLWISDFLDEYGIAYTGSNRQAHELQRNKHLAKQRVLDCGLSTSGYFLVDQNADQDTLDVPLGFPLFVKPADRGGGFGIDSNSVVYNVSQLRQRITYLSKGLGLNSLVEQYLPGREFSVAVLKDDISGEFLAMPIELIAPLNSRGTRLLSGKVKSSNLEQAYEVIDAQLKNSLSELALKVFEALGARDYGRIDIRLDMNETPQFLEANLIPSLISGYGSFPKACVLNQGLGYDLMINKIVNLGLKRHITNLDQLPQEDIIEHMVYPANEVLKPV